MHIKHEKKAFVTLLIVFVLSISVLTGCSGSAPVASTAATDTSSTIDNAPTVQATMPVPLLSVTSSPGTDNEPMDSSVAPTGASALSDTQRNSISMLNFLAVLTQEINASQNSRLYLEEAYSSLINNTYPNVVDSRTLSQLASILDTLESYRMVSVKRDRLQFVYEQNRAQALREAIPNPLGLLGAVQSFSLGKLAASIVYMAVDSYSSYTSHSAQTDLQYLQDGWALDDEAAATLHESRKDTFSYMVRIVGDYNLPGDLALSENAVDEFVAWENNSNVVQRIQFLESNVGTYQALGMYWLVLAKSYYDNGDYTKCLNAVDAYESLGTRIFRRDYEYAQILPLAIISAGETLDGDTYVETVQKYISRLLDNTDYSDWALRYFAAQSYMELYARTKENAYIQSAYEIVLNNVNSLVNKQRAMNAEYLAPVLEAAVPKDATKEEKEEIQQYNKMLREARKTALPPVYEPLLLNCDLLFSLMNELPATDGERSKVDGILHEGGERLFLNASIDALYRFQANGSTDTSGIEIAFNGKELTVPAYCVGEGATIRVQVTNPATDEVPVFEDWSIVKVDRPEASALESFTATFKSLLAEKYGYAPNAAIRIEITPRQGTETLAFDYATLPAKTWVFFDTVTFQRVSP